MENSFEKKDFFVCVFKKYGLYLRYELKTIKIWRLKAEAIAKYFTVFMK